MIVNGGDISKINPEVVAKVEKTEQEEGYVATVTLQKIEPNIFMCNVVFAKPGTNQIAFTSLNLYQVGVNETVWNMQDGKVYGFESMGPWLVGDHLHLPESLEEFASKVLEDLFDVGWD